MASTDFAIAATETPASEENVSWKKIAIAVLLSVIVIFTAVSNLIVLITFYVEKKLRNTFTYFIANLAVTDFLVSFTAMLFYTFDTVLGYWPFGQFMCGVWIFCDYSMIFASVFTLVAISVDRYWAVMWSIHYRSYNNRTKSAIIISCIWISVVIICLPPCIVDRLKWSEPKLCWWDPSKNIEFAYFLSLVGHHLPCIVIIFCYIRVFMVTRKQFKVRPGVANTTGTKPVNFDSDSNNVHSNPSTIANQHSSAMLTTKKATVLDGQPNESKPGRSEKTTHDEVKETQDRISQEKKIFVTLSYILTTYMICWVPFHFMYDLTFLAPGVVSPSLFTFGFWMTYLNSTLNPVIYAFSNREFRKVAKRVVSCKYLK